MVFPTPSKRDILAAICGAAATALSVVYLNQRRQLNKEQRLAHGTGESADAYQAFLSRWGSIHGWDVESWGIATVYEFLSTNPRLCCVGPFQKDLWGDVDGETLLSMVGTDFVAEKMIQPHHVKQIMRAVCEAVEAKNKPGSRQESSADVLKNGDAGVDDLPVRKVLSCTYFSLLNRTEVDVLLLNSKLRTFDPGETIVSTGKVSTEFSIVLEGSVQRFTRDNIVVDQGFHHFGEQFIIKHGSVPTSSVKAGFNGCKLLVITSETWKTFMDNGLKWAVQANRRMLLSVRHRFGKYLQQVPFLSNVDRSSLDVLGSLFNTRSYHREESILRRGEPSQGFFLIMKGTVEVQIPSNTTGARGNERSETEIGESRYLCDTDAHNYFGEVSLMGDFGIVSANVIAAQESMLLHISPKSFKQFLACTGDEVVNKLRETLSHRSHNKARLQTGGTLRNGLRAHESKMVKGNPVVETLDGHARAHSALLPHVASLTNEDARAHDNIRAQLEKGF